MGDDTTDQILDTTGLKCPLPVLKARKALSAMPAGAVLRVIASDPGAPEDLRHFCEAAGHRLLDQQDGDGATVTRIAKGA
ncbi:MAG: sulfurtransferase TusA family protein [Alphaproteobacteria bacterium]